MSSRIVAHLDMDAFFASCEEQRHPELRGKPMVVGVDPREHGGRGVVMASNYAARAFRIRSAMSSREALTRNPSVAFVPPDHSHYSAVSRQIFAGLRRSFPLEQVSIDEAFVDLTPHTDWDHAAGLAAELHRRVEEASGGLTCSVGIGPNKLIAKIGSDFQKPNGTTLVRPDEVLEFLAPLAARKVPGIGPKTSARLEEQDVRTIADLRRVGREALVATFGSHGAWMFEAAYGRDESSVHTEWSPNKSVSEEHTFSKDTRDRRALLASLRRMVGSLEAELGRAGYWYKTVAIKVRFADFETHTKQASLGRHVGDTEAARRLIPRLLDAFLEDERPVRLIGLRFGELAHGLGQRTLREFATPEGGKGRPQELI